MWQNVNWQISFSVDSKTSKIKRKKIINLKTSTSCWEENARVKINTVKMKLLAWLLALDLHKGRLDPMRPSRPSEHRTVGNCKGEVCPSGTSRLLG